MNLSKSRSSRDTKRHKIKNRQPKMLKISGYNLRGLQQKDDLFTAIRCERNVETNLLIPQYSTASC